VIFLHTSLLVDALAGPGRSAVALRNAIGEGHRIMVPCLVLFEWLRGPRVPAELAAQEALFPTEAGVTFGPREAVLGAKLYRSVRRPRGRETDLAIAACAITHEALLWTLSTADFADIPGLRLYAA